MEVHTCTCQTGWPDDLDKKRPIFSMSEGAPNQVFTKGFNCFILLLAT